MIARWLNKTLPAISVLLWSGLAGLRLLDAWQNTQIIPALLAAQSGLVAWLLSSRRRQAQEGSWQRNAVAWISALLPLVLFIQAETPYGQAVTILGLLLVLWAMTSLGQSFGIAPADRGLVWSGPYRLIRHPMYLGELISLAGAVLGSPSLWNIALIFTLLVTLLVRIRWEELTLFEYGRYAGQVRWRLIPGIW